MINKHIFSCHFTLILITALLTGPIYAADTFTAEVTDISDRRYEPAVIELLDSATESIVISMYGISLGTKTPNPVKLLLNDLLEARERGVSVTILYNTLFRDTPADGNSFETSSIFKALTDAGCELHPIPIKRRLHDKLIIIDNRYVVEGSANWSISALRDNFESSTLIDSPDLARVKLERIGQILMGLLADAGDERTRTASYLIDLPETLIIRTDLLLDKQYFPAMLTESDTRSMDLYLLLLAHSQVKGESEFFVSLEDMALSLGLPDSWIDTALRRQVIKSLNKLEDNYHLITVKFFYGKDARVILVNNSTHENNSVEHLRLAEAKHRSTRSTDMLSVRPTRETDKPRPTRSGSFSGDTFSISTDSIINKDDSMTLRLKFLLLIKALLIGEGKDLYSESKAGLSRRFGVSLSTITSAFGDLREYVNMTKGLE